MSLILEALNKSDRDAKNYGGAPTLNTMHHLPLGRDRAKLLLLAVIAVLIAIAIALLVVILLKQTPVSTTPTPQADPNLSPAQVAAPTPPSKALKPEQVEPAITTQEAAAEPPPEAAADADADVAALYAPQVASEEIALPAPKVITPAQPAPTSEAEALARYLWEESKPKALPEELQQAVRASEQAAITQTAEPKEATTAIEEELPDNSIKTAQDVPFLHRLAQSVQNSIPSLMYAEHRYDEGYVIINKKRVTVGDPVANNVTLEEIRADGVILSMNNTRFKLSAQSSWVNYSN